MFYTLIICMDLSVLLFVHFQTSTSYKTIFNTGLSVVYLTVIYILTEELLNNSRIWLAIHHCASQIFERPLTDNSLPSENSCLTLFIKGKTQFTCHAIPFLISSCSNKDITSSIQFSNKTSVILGFSLSVARLISADHSKCQPNN